MSTPALTGALAALAALCAFALTRVVRGYALDRAILDVPNHRSSHAVPTPRGGGLAIVAAVLAGIAAAVPLGLLSPAHALAIGGGGGTIALIGWIDDRKHVPARYRALVHFTAAGWALYWLGGLPSMQAGGTRVALGLAGAALAAMALVWMTNLYNFMDGIDGLAAGEAVSVGALGGALLWWGGEPGLALVAFLVAAASYGFLAWNWPPARIFMGDVGSGFLGFVFAALAVASENARSVPLLVWFLLLGVFVLDATLTLARRVKGGERWFEPHRSHAYQRAVQAGWTHARVTGTILAVNLVLGAAAAAAYLHAWLFFPGLAAGALLLLAMYLWVEKKRPMPRLRGDAAAP